MGAEAAATAVAVGTTMADGADATLAIAVLAVTVGEAVGEFGIVEALGDTCAVGSAALGAIRRKLRISFVTEKPTTSTKIPIMSGTGDIRSPPEGRTTGRLTAFCGAFSSTYHAPTT